MNRAACLVAAALVGVVLTGCAAPSPNVPPPPTYAEALDYWQLSMDSYWDSIEKINPDLEKPDIPFTGFIADPETRSLLVTACQLQLGLYYKPGRPSTVPGGVDLIYYTCERKNPQDPRTSGYFTNAQLSWLYDFLAHRVAPCVALHGYNVPPAPTRDQYVANTDHVRYSWSPYEYLPGDAGDSVWDSVYRACPQLPNDEFQFLEGVITDHRL